MRALSGGLSIVDNRGLRDLSGLAIERVAGDLLIGKLYPVNLIDPCDWELAPGGNADLQSLAGLDALTHVGGTLAIACNPQLTRIGSLSFLETVGQDLLLLHNPKLADLADLGGPEGRLKAIGGAFVVRCSSELDQSAIDAVLSGVAGEVPRDIILDC